jgi:subtilisin-like proprotein convertase family protein
MRRLGIGVCLLAGLVLVALPAAAGAKTKTKTFSSLNIARVIPDGGPGTPDLVSGIGVDKKGEIKDVNVSVRISHTFDADLNLYVTSPRGKNLLLSKRNGGNGDDYGAGNLDCTGSFTIFDDSATVAINAGVAPAVAPFVGAFKPQELLSANKGDQMKGTWALRVSDQIPGDVGTLRCWQVQIKYKVSS